jgi:aminocarboxymuconate-semialdehyde decarboxylase
LGTDYPFDMALPDPVGFVSSAKKLSPADKARILGGNAVRLLGLKIPQAKAKRRR